MNSLIHFFVNYILLTLLFGDVSAYMPVIFIASIILDFDHAPYLLRERKKIGKKGLAVECRSFMHEISGLGLLTIIALPLFFLIQPNKVILLVYLSLAFHILLDFILGDSRPLYPFSKKKFSSPLAVNKSKHRVPIEIAVTLFVFVLFLLALQPISFI
ncbi:metal-dependent hydrolase [Candidatus Woesearchaeota archaeon]|nr:metal-dependent hydrolase [Candidatus Woesearchaeota archaeon]